MPVVTRNVAAQAKLKLSALSTASRYAALQRAFSDRLREWYWQRNTGTVYQVWNPPGVVFSRLRKDHYEHGRRLPAWGDWAFEEPAEGARMHLVIGAMGGRWAVWQARRHPDEQFVVADSDDGRMFNAFQLAMNTYRLDPEDPGECFPNLRLLHVTERFGPRFFSPNSVGHIHIHMPLAPRATRPFRQPLITPKFISDISDVLQFGGRVHVVSDHRDLVEDASATFMRSKLFDPGLPFPFHSVGVPSDYAGSHVIKSDASRSKDDLVGQLFYARWEKQQPRFPNFRFKSGKGYAAALQQLPTPVPRIPS